MSDRNGGISTCARNHMAGWIAAILRPYSLLGIAALCGVLFATPASAQWAAADLFPDPPAPVEAGPHGLEGLGGVIDPSPVLRGLGRLRLQLPGSSMVEMARDGFERRSDGGVSWRGRVTDDEGSRVILTVKDGYMAGRILRGLDEYRIIPGPGRSHVIERVDGSVDPVDEHVEPPVDYSYDIGPVYEPGGYSPNYGNSPDNIQLLVVYSLDALAAAGGEKQIEVQIQSMVDQLNTAFIDSGMIARVALVQTVAANYSDSGNVLTDLDWLTFGLPTEPVNLDVHNQRQFYAADLVSMVVDNGGLCSGVAYVMHKPAYDFVSYAYSVTALNCGGAGLAHEIGHNMGFEHNPEDSARYQGGQQTATPFSFGHYVDGSFRTIMSYATPCLSGCPMAYRFSNPNLDFLGSPTGIANERDNAWTGDYTAPIVTDFMDAVTGAVVNRRVSASVDDVEELVDGSIVVDSTTLELGDGLAGVQAVGLRFQSLNIPVGVRIDSAYLEFEAADIGGDATSVAIRAEAADNAAAFSTTPYDVTGRTATAASVQWDLPAWDTVTEKHYSPDISAVIQEIVDRPGWAENNSMVITVGGTGIRTALAHDGAAASAPLLHVEYSDPGGPASISTPVAAYSYTCADLTCSFTDESTDSDGVIIFWSWDFGEGTFSEEQHPTFTFPTAGTYTVSLYIVDDQGWEGYSEKQVSVVVGNSPPVATEDTYTTTEDTPVSGNVLTDGTPDSDINGDPLTVTSNTDPSNGSVTVAADGAFTYTPNAGYGGTDSFTYTISDGNGGSATATVSVTVRTNVVATDNSYTTSEDTSVSGNVLTDGTPDSDIDGDTLTVAANTNVSYGIVTVAANGAFTYTPNADFWGWDDFTYTVSDGAGNSATATVNITIAAVNDPPVIGFVYSCNGLNCSFAGAMTDVDSVVNFSVLWDFGDGTTDNWTTVGNVLHSYPADGTYTVILAVTDSDGATGTATQTVTVSNNPPVAYDKSYQTWYPSLSGNMMTGYVSGGTGTVKYSPDDSDPDGDTLTVVSNTNPSYGTLTVWDTAGNFTYGPDSGFYGYDSFTYTVSDGNGATATAAVNITVNETPMAGFTADCSGRTCNFTNTSIDNLGPISQWDWSFGDGAVSTDQNPAHTYASRGSYMVTLTVTDVLGDSSTESYSVWIPNAAPVATDNSYETYEDVPLSGNVLTDGTPDSDPDGDALIVMANTNPSNGTVSVAASGVFTYTPSAGFMGSDSFTYTISDGAGGSDTASVTLTVNPVNDMPVAAFTHGCAGLNCVFTDGSTDIDGSIASWAWSFGDGAISTLQSPAHSYAADGTYTVSLTVTDNDGATDTATQTVTVANTAPVATDNSYSFDEDTILYGNLLTDGVADSDPDGDSLTLVSMVNLTEPGDAVTVWDANGDFSIRPNANVNGVYNFTYTVSDGKGGSATAAVTVTINPINDAPVAVDDSYTIPENDTLTGNVIGVSDTDVDGDTLTVTANTNPSNGTLTMPATGIFTYIPTTGFNGSDSFTYTISDGKGGSDTATVTITVNPVNDAPVATANAYVTNEDNAVSGNVLTDGTPDSDIEGDALTVAANTNPPNGAVIIAADGAFTYTPGANFNGSDSFTYTISDGNGGSDTGTVAITINPVNDAPVATANSYSISEDNAVSGNVLTDGTPDSDIDGDALTVTANTNPLNGAVIIATDGAFTYTPNTNYNGSDSFTYTISDGNDGSATATVTLTVNPINDAPVATDNAYATDAGVPVSGNVLTDGTPDRDVDGDILTAEVSGNPVSGTVTVAANGAFTYTPAAGFSGTDSFGYLVRDGNGGAAGATVSVTVNPGCVGFRCRWLTWLNRSGETGWSVPAAPGNLIGSATTGGTVPAGAVLVSLRWTDNSNNEDVFVIERCSFSLDAIFSSCNFSPVAEVGANVTVYAETVAAANYRYRVKARNAQGDSGYSNKARIRNWRM